MNSLLLLLQNYKLTRHEKELVGRFNANPNGLAFLPLVEVLKKRQLFAEAIELLSWGVEKNSSYIPARVILAKELYQRGMLQASWDTLQARRQAVSDNFLAQNILFKCAILLQMEDQARDVLRQLHKLEALDLETQQLETIVQIEGLGKARQTMLAKFRESGINPLLSPPTQKVTGPTVKSTPRMGAESAKSVREIPEVKHLQSFQVTPLKEVFQSGEKADKMREIEKIDRKIQFYQQLLQQLESQDTKI